MSEKFKRFWKDRFPGMPPSGDILKWRLKDRWVRFHSLPGSKPYANSSDEVATLLARANALAAEVIGENQPCWMVTNYIDDTPFFGEADVVKDYHLQASFNWQDLHEAEEDRSEWTAYAGEFIWETGRFDNLIEKIAEEEARALWLSPKTGRIFAPYPGGTDLIVQDATAVEALKAKFGDWLSPHAHGL